MPKNKVLKKILVIGSGPIVIGQGAEFDYAGTQACLTLKEEGYDIVLINNNPATIMTDEDIAHTVYFEPLTIKNIKHIINTERPDGLLATVSGQTGLNLAIELQRQGILEKYGVEVLGTSIESMIQGENREKFRAILKELDEPVLDSAIISNVAEAVAFAEKADYPLIVRPAYTLGGSGGGVAKNNATLKKYVLSGLRSSPINQCLIEKSIAGFKEIEFEVIRDSYGTCLPICHMENIDPVGIHTGDSVVVVPSQTLSQEELELLQTASLKLVNKLDIVGACNVQLAFNPHNNAYYFIEVNPRVSRSSALASKSTSYPIAKIATKLSIGYYLHELSHPSGKGSLANFKPKLDHIAIKFPRWPFDKFEHADRTLGTQMKSTGEVLAIEKNLASAMQKGIRSLELDVDGLSLPELSSLPNNELWKMAIHADDRRFFVLFELLRRDQSIAMIYKKTFIDPYFLENMKKLIKMEKEIETTNIVDVTNEQLLIFKQYGFSDKWLADTWDVSIVALREKREKLNIKPSFLTVGNKEDNHLYYYSTWNKQTKSKMKVNENKILIIGSGPIRIGQGVEFDYCSVHGVLALQHYGYEAVLMNNNPATVSTDVEIADQLYFEPLTVEDVLHVVEYEGIDKVIVQFGGQTAINLTKGLEAAGVTLLGSTSGTIDELEDRDRFYKLMKSLYLPHIPGYIADNKTDLLEKSNAIGFPVLLRPSYVIGGQGMVVLYSEEELEKYIAKTTFDYPLLIDAYFPGTEIEVDVISDGNDILIPAMFEHIEKAGVHSGDSMAVTPPISLSKKMKQQIVDFTKKIAINIEFIGVLNIQFVIHENQLYVLEVNPRASRTVPAISKATTVNIVKQAIGVLLGKPLVNLSSSLGFLPDNDFYMIKAPVFSTIKLPGVDPKLVPEMQSTGELITLSETIENGFSKALLWNEQLATDFNRENKQLYIDSKDKEVIEIINNSKSFPFTCINDRHLKKNNDTFIEWIKTKEAYGIISTTTNFKKRELALHAGLIVMTAVETVRSFATMSKGKNKIIPIKQWQQHYEKEVIKQ